MYATVKVRYLCYLYFSRVNVFEYQSHVFSFRGSATRSALKFRRGRAISKMTWTPIRKLLYRQHQMHIHACYTMFALARKRLRVGQHPTLSSWNTAASIKARANVAITSSNHLDEPPALRMLVRDVRDAYSNLKGMLKGERMIEIYSLRNMPYLTNFIMVFYGHERHAFEPKGIWNELGLYRRVLPGSPSVSFILLFPKFRVNLFLSRVSISFRCRLRH